MSLQAAPYVQPAILPEGWDELARAAGLDPLFNSADWLQPWWSLHAEPFGLEPATVLADGAGGARPAIGMLPLTARRVRHRGGLSGRRLELLGQLWRTSGGVMSEYLDAAAEPGSEPAAAAALVDRLMTADWADLVFSNVRDDSFVSRQLVPRLSAAGCFVRRCDPLDAWSVDLSRGFDVFAAGLKASLRRQVLGARKSLAALGEVRVELAGTGEEETFFATLNRLHALRWGAPVFTNRRLEFHLDLARRSNAAGAAWLSTLTVGGREIACQYDLRRGATQYNVQGGFDASVGHGLSPGYLQFGYAIEAACRDGLKRYDFLGGRGKQSDYKARFGGQPTGLVTWQVVRAPVLKAMYAAFDRLSR